MDNPIVIGFLIITEIFIIYYLLCWYMNIEQKKNLKELNEREFMEKVKPYIESMKKEK